MNRNPRNKGKDKDHNVYRLRKVSFWEKYGVQRFPYRGRHRYSPFAYQSKDGGIIISNDVFGLTIRQFDRIYKACLDRRKTRERNIINLRYPDKTSDEYLEYLQYSTDYIQDYVTWSGNNLTERNLYEHLVNTAGTEIDMRKRQQLFLTHDMIQNEIMLKLGSKLTEITAGSLAEGLDIPGSDIDIMYVIKDVDVIRDVNNIIYPVQRTTLVMETDYEYPGFTRLRLLAGGERESSFTPPGCFEVTRKGLYLSVNTFVSNIKKMHHHHYIVSSHGPCLTDHSQNVDYAYCLRRKIRTDNNEILKHVLYSTNCDGIDGLIQNVRQYDNVNPRLLSNQLGTSFITLDLLFYRISHLTFARLSDISQCLKLLDITEHLIQSKSSAFIVDVCKYHHTEISQYAAQLFPTQTVTTERYNMHKHCHKHLQDGIKANAVSGWLLYASFYYVTGQFNITLRLTDYVLSRCSPEMILLGGQNCHDRHVNYYRNHVHSTMTLRDKMRMAVVNNVRYVQHSSLIPQELQLEVSDHYIVVPPIVMSNFLRFLCYHHTGDFFNRQQALYDLCSTVKGRHSIDVNTLSMSMTILGVCCEISNDMKTADQCYKEALQCECYICATAKTRRSKL
ncbi:unnamed protein product [Mytilus coruscus]|uniref:Uncharacterized protein n=1 Tax=Mytilus coruscus TaxID=42192 RepID=A0A6J8F0B9_MYTCO|nr:unnamed protein product [Mytilus coruscus]